MQKLSTRRLTITLVTSFGAISLLSLISIGTFNRSEAAIEVSAQTLPTSVNINDLNDSQVNAYYGGVDGKSGDTLLAELYTIIDGHREYNYDSSTDRYAYKIMDRNWSLSPLTTAQLANFSHSNDMPYIRKFYADYNDDIATADLYFNAGDPEVTRVSFDKEHIWAQSMGNFGRTSGAGADFHMLVPSDVVGNQAGHSNYNFAVPTSSITNYYGSPAQTNSNWLGEPNAYVGRNGYISGYSQKVFEPLNQYKGDVARALFYMPARYYEYIDDTHPKLTLVNGSPDAVTASPSQAGLVGDLATLLQWNEFDPVDEYEIHRNNLIYNNYQLNRNPFIDHPEWARVAYDTAYSGAGASTADGTSSVGSQDILVSSIALDKTSHTMNVGNEYALMATVSPVNAANKILVWSSTNESAATVSDGTILALGVGSTTIRATATDGSGVYAECTLTVVAEGGQTLDYIAVSSAPASAPFGSIYDTSSIVVTAYYSDSSSEVVTSSATIYSPDTEVLGEQSVSVTYGGKTAYYTVDITNYGATISSTEVGTEFVSPTAATGAIAGWTGSGIGAAYSDGSVKFDSTNDYYYKADIWSGTGSLNISSISVTLKIRQNGGTSLTTANKMSVYAINGSASTEIGYAMQTAGFNTVAGGEDETFTITPSSPSTITGLKIVYAEKILGNLGLYYVKATPTYVIEKSVSQAEAWATYFLSQTSEQCTALEAQSSEVWTILDNEYNWMASSSKTYFTGEEVSSLVTNAIARYNAIISAHPENSPFISGLNAGLNTSASDDSDLAGLVVFFTGAILAAGFFLFYRVKRPRKGVVDCIDE